MAGGDKRTGKGEVARAVATAKRLSHAVFPEPAEEVEFPWVRDIAQAAVWVRTERIEASLTGPLRFTGRARSGGSLRLGFEATGAGRVGTLAQGRFAAAHPEVRLEPRRSDWGGEADALRNGDIDVPFVWLPNDLHGLDAEPLCEEARYAAMSAAHPLAGRSELRLADLDDEPIMWTRRASRAWVDWWAVNPRPSGRAPRWGPENENVEEMLEQVAAGLAYCLGPASMARNTPGLTSAGCPSPTPHLCASS
jgi:DNA-binding transcriptional LysR family regulator